MTIDTLNLLLGIGGFLLGLIAAYSQLKSFATRALNSSQVWLSRWAKRHREETAILADYPSAFVAYCMRRLVMAFGVLFLIPYFSSLLKTAPLAPHPSLTSVMSLILPSYCGILFGLIISRSDDVREHVARLQQQANS